MSYIADLHIHSRFAQACSKNLNIPNLSQWAKWKGLDLLGTGDCLHPLWLEELKQDLKQSSNGLYDYDGVKFLPTTEVSLIYSDYQKLRRVHIVIILSNLEEAIRLAKTLADRGVNIAYDGRPVIGMSCQKLCQIVWGISPAAIIIPAHIWTPWFGLFGSKSGYDSLEECFGEFSEDIYAIETGLSSEPAMNWRIGQLDSKSIVSFSDAHSLPRLAREATVFAGNLSFSGLSQALKHQQIMETIEFFPEEGKYHYSGHRACGIVYNSEDLKEKGRICPVCHKPLTVGVLQRVEELATRSEADLKLERQDSRILSKAFSKRPKFRMLVQLEEIIAESLGVGVQSKKVKAEYERLVTELAPELEILMNLSVTEIEKVAGERIAQGVEKVRQGELQITPGFDNTYGKVKIRFSVPHEL